MKKTALVLFALFSVPLIAFFIFMEFFLILPGNGWEAISETVESAGGGDEVYKACMELTPLFSMPANHSNYELNLNEIELPEVFNNMGVIYVYLSKEHVTVDLSRDGMRMSLLAFEESAPQYGTKEIVNGLWYWNGSASKETRPIYNKIVEHRLSR